MARNSSRSSGRDAAITSKATTVVARVGSLSTANWCGPSIDCTWARSAGTFEAPSGKAGPSVPGPPEAEPVEAAARDRPPRAPVVAAAVPVSAPSWSRRRLEIRDVLRSVDDTSPALPSLSVGAGWTPGPGFFLSSSLLKIGPQLPGGPGARGGRVRPRGARAAR